jgi:hypothetical protein
MLRRLHINADPRGRSARFLRAAADLGRRPFELVVWPLERRVIWPLRERLAGWSSHGHIAGAAALAVLAVAAVAAGVLWPAGGNGSGHGATGTTRIAVVEPTAQPTAEPSHGPVLHGAAPSFDVGKGVGVSEGTSSEASSPSAEAPAATELSPETAAPDGSPGATTSSTEPVPAGPAAMKVARRFADAFVFYEIGEHQARAKAVFGETAEPQLATALAERPPRLPEDAKVPKARVVNLVPGPRLGKAYTVSVSLLRVGLTSELRLEMEKKQGEWAVTDVRG